METSGKDVPTPIDTFDGIGLPEGLMKNVRRCKYDKPTPVQRYAIPISLGKRDLMACAQTGSGKTAAFCFPIIANILTSGTPSPCITACVCHLCVGFVAACRAILGRSAAS